MPTKTALVREPGRSFVRALSTHPQKDSIHAGRARDQHRLYANALQAEGVRVLFLDPLESCPDATFVEDTAVIFTHCAVICRMKEESRRGETPSVAEEISGLRTVKTLRPPVTCDGGDILDTGEALFAGLSRRTNREALEALSTLSGRPVIPVRVLRGLHLKSGVSFLGGNLLVIDPSSVETDPFKNFEWIEVRPEESYAANCLTLGGTVLMPSGYPRLEDKIREHGFKVVALEMSEFQKADGGVTCLSLIIPEAPD